MHRTVCRSTLYRSAFHPASLGSIGLLLVGCSEPSGGGLPDLDQRSVPVETATNYALVFDGASEYASTGNSGFPVAKVDQSITAWVRPARSGADQAFFTIRRGTESGTQLGLSDGLPTVWNVWGMRVAVQGATALSLDTWYHFAYVQTVESEEDSYRQELYVDGELVAESGLPPQSRTPTSSWLGTFDATSSLYAGALDDLRFYARALSAAEVSADADGSARPDPDGLVASWSFDEVPGESVAFDRSGFDNHATLGDGISSLAPLREPSTAPSAP